MEGNVWSLGGQMDGWMKASVDSLARSPSMSASALGLEPGFVCRQDNGVWVRKTGRWRVRGWVLIGGKCFHPCVICGEGDNRRTETWPRAVTFKTLLQMSRHVKHYCIKVSTETSTKANHFHSFIASLDMLNIQYLIPPPHTHTLNELSGLRWICFGLLIQS